MFRLEAWRGRASLGSALSGGDIMMVVWFIIWLIANNVGEREPLLLNPVNAWAATLILAMALDLSAAHARRAGRGR